MFVAVAADTEKLAGPVSAEFEQCKYVLIVNMDDMSVKAVEHLGDPEGLEIARAVIDHDCEAIITGKIAAEAFELLAGACVTRYNGYGHAAKDAIALMDRYELNLIRDVEQNDECQVTHSEDSCEGHHH